MVDLDKMCKRLGLSIKQLSEAIGLAPSTIYKWNMKEGEGGATPSYKVLGKLLELGATVEELFGYDCTQSCPKSVQYKQIDQRPGQAAESSKNYSAELNDPLADSPTMQAVLKRLAALEQRSEGNAKAG